MDQTRTYEFGEPSPTERSEPQWRCFCFGIDGNPLIYILDAPKITTESRKEGVE